MKSEYARKLLDAGFEGEGDLKGVFYPPPDPRLLLIADDAGDAQLCELRYKRETREECDGFLPKYVREEDIDDPTVRLLTVVTGQGSALTAGAQKVARLWTFMTVNARKQRFGYKQLTPGQPVFL
jgi:hypothetical protein